MKHTIGTGCAVLAQGRAKWSSFIFFFLHLKIIYVYSQEQLFERFANWPVLLNTIQLEQRWYNETYHWYRVCRFGTGSGKMVQFHIFLFFLHLKIIYVYSQEQLFERVANWPVLLNTIQLEQRWYNETYHWYRVCRFGTGSGKMVQFHIFFYFSYISRLYMFTFRIAIVSRFLPNIMVIEWIFLTWDHFFLSYAISPWLPLHPWQYT